jgi:hypothetical protein
MLTLLKTEYPWSDIVIKLFDLEVPWNVSGDSKEVPKSQFWTLGKNHKPKRCNPGGGLGDPERWSHSFQKGPQKTLKVGRFQT